MAEINKADIGVKIFIAILIAVFLGLTAYNMLGGKSDQAAGPGGMPAGAPGSAAGGAPGAGGAARGGQARITVSAVTMELSSFRQTIKLNGNVASRSEVSIFPETSGKVIRLIKSVGDPVRVGDVIGYIDPSRAGAIYEMNPITSTVSGSIITLPIAVGDTVSTATKAATVGSLSNLKITVYVAEKYSAYLKSGLPAEVSFAAAPGEIFTAKVNSVNPVVNTANRTIETGLLLDKLDSRVKAGMYAAVELVIREVPDALVLPKTAIKTYNDEQVVYVIDANDIARRITVTTGLSNDTEIEILTGLEPGDRIITAGSVTDGSPVRVAESF